MHIIRDGAHEGAGRGRKGRPEERRMGATPYGPHPTGRMSHTGRRDVAI